MIDVILYIDIFNSREKAIIIWFIIFLVWALPQKNIRISILGVFKSLFQKTIITVFIMLLFYVSLVVFLFYRILLWDISLIKNTLFWILGTAFVLLMNANKATQDEHYFKKILLDNLRLILVLEFIVNFYTFNLWVEIILLPLLFIIISMGTVAEMKKENIPVKKVINFILAFFGVFLIIFSLFKIFTDYQGLATTDNLRSFLMPPLLTLAYMPFLYLFSLFVAYESFFVRLDIFLKKDKTLTKLSKRKIFTLCHVNLGKLNKFAKESTQELVKLNNSNDIMTMIGKFKKKRG